MTKVDDFKSFVKKNPNLLVFVRNESMSWQKFYELYDLYGEDGDVWKDYLKHDDNLSSNSRVEKKISTGNTFSNIMEMAKNIDTDKLQDGISSIQKAIGLFSDMLIKDNNGSASNGNYTPRPIYRRFDD